MTEQELDSIYREMLDAPVTPEEEAEAERAFLEFAERTGVRNRRKSPLLKKAFIRVAAALALPLAAATVLLAIKAAEPETQWLEAGTSYSETRQVTLSDGTVVNLSPCSKIYYPEEFSGKQRHIFLVGEAFLDVAKDPKHKFTVSAGSMEIVVHGTRFNVNSFPNDAEDEVALIEGSVEMKFKDEDGSIFLKPGEMVKYDKVTRTAERRKFAINYYEEVMNNGGIQFVNDKFRDIAAELSRRFNVQIVIEDQSVADERYYASFINGENVDAIMEALNTQGHMRIERGDNSIRIYREK